MLCGYERGDRLYALVQFLACNYGQESEWFAHPEDPMRAWVSELPTASAETLRRDIEHFRATVLTPRERRAYFDLFLWLDEDGKDLDELLELTHQTITEKLAASSSRRVS